MTVAFTTTKIDINKSGSAHSIVMIMMVHSVQFMEEVSGSTNNISRWSSTTNTTNILVARGFIIGIVSVVIGDRGRESEREEERWKYRVMISQWSVIALYLSRFQLHISSTELLNTREKGNVTGWGQTKIGHKVKGKSRFHRYFYQISSVKCHVMLFQILRKVQF